MDEGKIIDIVKKVGKKIGAAGLNLKDNIVAAKGAYDSGDYEELNRVSDRMLEQAVIGAGVILTKKIGLGFLMGEDIVDVISETNPIIGGIVLAQGIGGLLMKDYVQKVKIKEVDVKKHKKSFDEISERMMRRSDMRQGD